jgi:hypothetical protein
MLQKTIGDYRTPYIDEVSSRVRSNIMTLHNILDTIVRTYPYENDYVTESLSELENDIKNLKEFVCK